MKISMNKSALFVLSTAGLGAVYDRFDGVATMMNACFLAALAILLVVELMARLDKSAAHDMKESAELFEALSGAEKSPKKITLTQEQATDWLQKIWMRQEQDGALLGKIHLELQQKGLMSSTQTSARFNIHTSKKAPPVPIVRDEESLKTMNNRAGMETGLRWALRGTRSRGGVFMGYASCAGTWTTDKRQVQTFPSADEAMKACPKHTEGGSVVVTAVLYH